MGKKIILSERKLRGLFEEQIGVSYDNDLSLAMACGAVVEGLVKTYPFETMLRYVSEHFNIPPFYMHSYRNNDVMCVAIDVPKEEHLQSRIDKAMNLCGYFESIRTSLDSLDRIHYEPKFEEEEKVGIGDFLYHVTHAAYLDKIKKIGLCPYHKNTFFNYPSRIYFFRDSTPFAFMEQTARNLFTYSKGDFNDGRYAVLKIDVNKLPSNVKFYVDPNTRYGIYTTNNIPPKCILDEVEIIDVLKK